MKITAVFALWVAVNSAWAAIELVDTDGLGRLNESFQIFNSTAVLTSTLYVEGGPGTEESNPIDVYVPYAHGPTRSNAPSDWTGAGTAAQALPSQNYTILGTAKTSDTDAVLPSDAEGNIIFNVKQNSGSDQKIRLLMQDDDDEWVVISRSVNDDNGEDTDFSSGVDLQVKATFDNICNSTNDCDIDNPTTAGEENPQKEVTGKLFYLAHTGDGIATTGTGPFSDLSNFPNGLYFELRFSNRIAYCDREETSGACRDTSGNTVDDGYNVPQISRVKSGDTSLTFVVDSSGLANSANLEINAYGTFPVIFTADQANDIQDWQEAVEGGAQIVMDTDDIQIVYTGEQTFFEDASGNKLVNDTKYYLGFIAVNKYQFATPMIGSIEGTPLEILQFLNEQSCYLLSAGFKYHHPTLDYFRRFRDQTLKKYALGRHFIDFYYKTAPRAARTIMDNPFLGHVVREVANGLKYTMQFFGVNY